MSRMGSVSQSNGIAAVCLKETIFPARPSSSSPNLILDHTRGSRGDLLRFLRLDLLFLFSDGTFGRNLMSAARFGFPSFRYYQLLKRAFPMAQHFRLEVTGAVSVEEGSPLDAWVLPRFDCGGPFCPHKRQVRLSEIVRNNGWIMIFCSTV